MTQDGRLTKNSKRRKTDRQLQIQEKFNYAIAPERIPVEEIICGVEAYLPRVPEDIAEVIRQDVARNLRTAKPPKKNLLSDEKQSLRELQKNKDIVVLPADKGNVTVVMDILEYNQKIEDLLKDPIYKTISILKQLQKLKSKLQH